MGSFTASSDSSGRDADRPGRPLWQAPFFAVGVAALVFVGLTRPTLGNVAGRRLDRELSAVRKLLTRPDGELEEVVHRAGAALETARVTAPDRVGEAHFLLGSALVCLTEHAEADRSATGWRAARTHLEE